jgi:hypothetical protein
MTKATESSPFPGPLSSLLALIVRGALESYQSGEVDIEGAILHAAVHGWYEGHIKGEECEGCPIGVTTTKSQATKLRIGS